ncbi:MAG: hypothetical protein HYX71_05670 [Opitutae bacterium]|nr:hypothetical protein [Opitutae bacterium]
MSFADLRAKFRANFRHQWAELVAGEPAARPAFAPEFPASVFVRPEARLPHQAVQDSGTAARQRSASISTSSG